ncbi:MAG: CubicO group peptidase (beta-lactamase class C family) [Candidatus Azotimanducaceae bacterium]|jgi:CubicO group peptidase (beta-lactamase class C family)
MRIIKWTTLVLGLTIVWGAFVVASTLNGWFRPPIAPVGDPDAFMKSAIAFLQKSESANIAFVLIEDGQTHGTYFSAGLNQETLFPVASMSKWFTAYGVMALVESAKIDLDAPVENYLSRWQLPGSEFNNDLVTTRLLLSHRAGLSDGLGFADYTADEQMPSLEESLANPRASSGAQVVIGLSRQPGTEWDYSGGSYLLLELIIEEVSGQPFTDYIQQTIFDPLEMSRSTYDYLGDQQNTAQSLTIEAQAVPFYRYAAASATGLATTARDLTAFLQAQISAGPNSAPLPSNRLEQMRAPQASLFGVPIWGLGTILYAENETAEFVFGHSGQNEPAINSEARINPSNGNGIIVLVNGAPSLATRLGNLWTIWQTGRPDFLSLGAEFQRAMPWFGTGVLLILLAAIFGFWRSKP